MFNICTMKYKNMRDFCKDSSTNLLKKKRARIYGVGKRACMPLGLVEEDDDITELSHPS